MENEKRAEHSAMSKTNTSHRNLHPHNTVLLMPRSPLSQLILVFESDVTIALSCLIVGVYFSRIDIHFRPRYL
jgi:hypothetical protein